MHKLASRVRHRHHHGVARAGALPRSHGLRVGRRQPHLSRRARPDRPPAGGDGGGRRAQGADRGVPQRQQCRDLVRRRRRPRPGIDRHLAASAGRARRSPRGHRGCRGIGADRRSQDACAARRRARRQGRAPRDRAHHGQGGFRTRRDGGGRQDRRGERRSISPTPTTTRSSTTPAARPASPRARSGGIARARRRRWRSRPTSSFPPCRAILRRRPSPTSPAPR